MNTFALAWILLLAFTLFNTYAVYRLLKPRSRMDLLWIPIASSAIPIVLFALWPGAFTLLAFPLLQSAGFWLLFRLLSHPEGHDK